MEFTVVHCLFFRIYPFFFLNFCCVYSGELNGDMMGTTTPTSLMCLRVAPIPAIYPENFNFPYF